MAITVPRKSETRVKRSVLPGVRISTNAPIEAFGGGTQGVAAAARGVAGAVQEIALQQKQRADSIKVREGRSNLVGWYDDYLNNPKTGALNRLGETSFTLPEESQQAFNAKVQEIQGGFGNETQRRDFSVIAQDYQNRLQNRVNIHVSDEIFRYDERVFKSDLANESNVAINGFDVPTEREESISNLRSNIEQYAKDNGLPPEWIQKTTFDVLSATHIGVVSNFVPIDSDEARKYFNENKDEINKADLNGSDLEEMIRKMEVGKKKVLKIDYNKNEQELSQRLFEGKISLQEIRQMEILGEANAPNGISKGFATSAKEYIKSEGTINPITKAVSFNKLQDMYVDLEITSTAKGITDSELEKISDFRIAVLKAMGAGEITQDDGQTFLKNSSVAFDVTLEDAAKREAIKGMAQTMVSWTGALNENIENTKTLIMQRMMNRVNELNPEKLDQSIQQEVIDEEHIKRHPERKDYKSGQIYTEGEVTFKFIRFLNAEDVDVEVVD